MIGLGTSRANHPSNHLIRSAFLGQFKIRFSPKLQSCLGLLKIRFLMKIIENPTQTTWFFLDYLRIKSSKEPRPIFFWCSSLPRSWWPLRAVLLPSAAPPCGSRTAARRGTLWRKSGHGDVEVMVTWVRRTQKSFFLQLP